MNVALKNYYEKYWSEGAHEYSGDRQGYAPNLRQWMNAQLHGLPAESGILEVGCGDASFTKCLTTFSANVTALDISAPQIEENSRAHPQIEFLQHDVAEPLPFPDETFEVIWCSEVLEHLFDPAFALKEMHRALVPGGRLLITVPFHGRLKDTLIALFKWDEHFSPNNPHIRFFTRNTLTRLAAAAGFVEIHTTTCGMNRPLRDLIIATNLLLTARKR